MTHRGVLLRATCDGLNACHGRARNCSRHELSTVANGLARFPDSGEAGPRRGSRAERGTPRDLGNACAVAEAGVRAEVLRRWALCQPVFIGVAHGLGAISGAGLVEDPVDVGLDGCVAEDELVGDFAVRQAEGD